MTTTTTTTKAPPPLSKFEGKGSVQGLRAWAAAFSSSITANDKKMKAVATVSTPGGLQASKGMASEDMGLLYPGPLPFTPVKVVESKSLATVQVCLQSRGWGLNPKTKLPAESREVVPADFTLKRSGGGWKFDSVAGSRRDCSGVKVKGVAS